MCFRDKYKYYYVEHFKLKIGPKHPILQLYVQCLNVQHYSNLDIEGLDKKHLIQGKKLKSSITDATLK